MMRILMFMALVLAACGVDPPQVATLHQAETCLTCGGDGENTADSDAVSQADAMTFARYPDGTPVDDTRCADIVDQSNIYFGSGSCHGVWSVPFVGYVNVDCYFTFNPQTYVILSITCSYVVGAR